jgi:hypothetical protein
MVIRYCLGQQRTQKFLQTLSTSTATKAFENAANVRYVRIIMGTGNQPTHGVCITVNWLELILKGSRSLRLMIFT